MRVIVYALGALPVLMSASGCATWGPAWSEISGERYNKTIMYRRPAIIEKVDGWSSYAAYPIKIAPGKHELVLGGPIVGWPGGAPLNTMTLEMEPCKRYYVNAQFENPVGPNWAPVVDYVESIAGCGTTIAAK